MDRRPHRVWRTALLLVVITLAGASWAAESSAPSLRLKWHHQTQFGGKTISFSPTHELHLRAMLKQVGVGFRSLRVRPYGYDLQPWYRGEVQIWAGYVMNQPVDAHLAGHEVTIIFPDDYGVHLYDDLVVVAEGTLRRQPELIRRVLRASAPLIHAGEAPIGWMRREVMEQAQALLREQALLARVLPVEATFTTQYLPAQDELSPLSGQGAGPRP
ncbi:MAG: ABC transporter substrate-binding protein [Deltaproteobacteria bacterium]|nr:ABC transporter substrate-binding protein [Deltaproteobacteria bacterium]